MTIIQPIIVLFAVRPTMRWLLVSTIFSGVTTWDVEIKKKNVVKKKLRKHVCRIAMVSPLASLVTDCHSRHPKGPRSQAQTSCGLSTVSSHTFLTGLSWFTEFFGTEVLSMLDFYDVALSHLLTSPCFFQRHRAPGHLKAPPFWWRWVKQWPRMGLHGIAWGAKVAGLCRFWGVLNKDEQDVYFQHLPKKTRECIQCEYYTCIVVDIFGYAFPLFWHTFGGTMEGAMWSNHALSASISLLRPYIIQTRWLRWRSGWKK